MFTIIALIILAIVVLILLAASFQPGVFSISRSRMVAAPAAVVFAQVNDFQKWEAWSPWAKLDPNVKNAFEGPEAGVGAVFSWEGNSKVGAGRMTIVESDPVALIKIKLEFFKPFEATNAVEFNFRPAGAQTEVTWTMTGKNSFIGKVIVLFMNCDKMIGGYYEKGLASLDSVSQAASRQ